MSADGATGAGLALMLLLGLRHGVDPDHIAMIDSMVFRGLEARSRVVRWVGTLFAMGHGLAVTLIAVALGSYAGGLALPSAVRSLLDWLPIMLLILVGTLNLRDLLRRRAYRVTGWKAPFMPRRLRESVHPLAIFAVGVVFALVFDTASQAAAWGYAASRHAGTATALWLGLTFTAGMVITDTLDGRMMARLLSEASRRAEAADYRRKIGWAVVALSYAMAFYGGAQQLFPPLEIGDTAASLAGFLFFFALLAAYMTLMRRPAVATTTTLE